MVVRRCPPCARWCAAPRRACRRESGASGRRSPAAHALCVRFRSLNPASTTGLRCSVIICPSSGRARRPSRVRRAVSARTVRTNATGHEAAERVKLATAMPRWPREVIAPFGSDGDPANRARRRQHQSDWEDGGPPMPPTHPDDGAPAHRATARCAARRARARSSVPVLGVVDAPSVAAAADDDGVGPGARRATSPTRASCDVERRLLRLRHAELRRTGQTINIQVSTSPTASTGARPGVRRAAHLRSWAQQGETWAPSVAHEQRDSEFVMYYTATEASTGDQCIGVATARCQARSAPTPTPGRRRSCARTGPTVPAPSMRGTGAAASTPTSSPTRPATSWLLWKSDGNHIGISTSIRSVPLTANLLPADAACPSILLWTTTSRGRAASSRAPTWSRHRP